MTGKKEDKTESPTVLEVKDLRIGFRIGGKVVPTIRGISYSLKKGEVLGIVGESGSGKSISTNAIMRLLPENAVIQGGQILFEGKDILKLHPRDMQKIRGSRIAEIFQDPMTSLDPLFTIGYQMNESLKKHTTLGSAEREKRMIELLKLVGINQPEKRLDQYPHEFSGGMRQRAMIAMALSCDPEILIADEPTTALDVTIQAQIIDLLKSLRDKIGMSIIFITHDLGVVADICDRILVMYAGEIVEAGDKRKIFYDHRHPYTEGLLKSIPSVTGDPDAPLIPIKGNPPEMATLGSECAFARRCPYAMKICARLDPPTMDAGGGHLVRCFQEYRKLTGGAGESESENKKRA